MTRLELILATLAAPLLVAVIWVSTVVLLSI